MSHPSTLESLAAPAASAHAAPEPGCAPARDPFADPEYGKDVEHGGHVIRSHPRWSLDQNQRNLTGYAGLAVVTLGSICVAVNQSAPTLEFLRGVLPENLHAMLAQAIRTCWAWRGPWFLLLTFLAMFLVETLVFKVHRRHFDFTRAHPVGLDGWARILRRWLALALCFALAAIVYISFGEYSFHYFHLGDALRGTPLDELPRHFYAKYILFFVFAVPTALTLSIPYFYLVERHARRDGPVDEWLVFWHVVRRALTGLFLRAHRADAAAAVKNPHAHNLLRALLVKLFWTPLMLTWCLNCWGHVENGGHLWLYERAPIVWSDPHHVSYLLRDLHFSILNYLICIDLTVGVIGYLTAMRLLDTQTTSAEPTLMGWVVALLCYPPINAGVTSVYFGYGSNEGWIHYFIDQPVWSLMANFMSLFLMAIYVWATYAFGLRFSNLTNRGIILTGPYKYIRHPAYISKNGAWWFEALPFCASPDWFTRCVWCLHLLAINILYGLRAYTEERHLMREEHYREYCKRVPWRFLPGIF
ncbi:MAG: hypothetical protein AMXMBFR7_42210 [Planctomycetota bacterium]